MPNNDLSTYLDPAPRARRHNYDDLIQKHASRTGLDPELVRAVVVQESGGNPRAVSPKGAQGIGQLMPATAKRFNVRDPYDPDENLRGATDYLKFLNDRFKGNRDLVLAGYNAGEGAVDRFKGIPPYRETQNYVKSINARLGQRQRQPTQPQSDLDSYLDPPTSPEQSTPRTSAGTRKSPPRATAAPANIEEALTNIMRSTNEATEQLKRQEARPTRGSSGIGELRRMDDPQAQQMVRGRQQVREDVIKERRGRVGSYGAPTPTGMLHLVSNPIDSLTGLFRSEDENVNREVAERLHQQQVAQTPEVTEIRKEYGQMSAPVRSVAAPLIGRGGGGLLKVAGGVASAFGIAPNRLSEWANKRGDIIEAGSTLAPLKEQQNLSSLITGDRELAEVERGVPEKVATGLADLGIGLAQIILLKKATRLPFNQLLALEAAARNSDKPLDKQLSEAAKGYALGTALERVPGRTANAAISGLPTAAQTGYEVSQGRMSPLDAAIQTGIQAGAGAILTPGRKPSALESGLAREPARERVEPNAEIAARLRGEGATDRGTSDQVVRGEPRDVVVSKGTQGSSTGRQEPLRRETVRTNAPEGDLSRDPQPLKSIEDYLDEPQVQTKPLASDLMARNRDTGAEIVRAKNAFGQPHTVAKYLSDSPLRDKVLEVLPRGSELAGDPSAPDMHSGPVRLRAPNGDIWEVDLSYDRRSDPSWTIIGPKMDGFAIRKTGEVDVSQAKVQPPVEAQRAEVKSKARTPRDLRGEVEDRPVGETSSRSTSSSEVPEPAQKFFHRDYGEVTESPNQKRVGKNRVRVVAEDGSEHVVKRPAGTGAGNQRAVPIRPEEPTTVTKPVTEPRLESTTAAKRESMSADRVALDLPELPPAERKSWQQSLSEAKPESAQRLADEVLNRPRALNDSETASVVVRAQQVKNEHAAKLREIESANESQLPRLKSELDVLEGEFDRLTQAARASGTEKGRALVAQKLTINQDFDLVSLVSRFKADAGRNPTPAERTQIEQLSKRNLELESQLVAANDKLAHSRLQSEINRISRRERRSQTKQSLDEEFAQLKQQFAQARAETKGVQPSGLAGLDPEGKLTRLIGKMARNRIQAGVTDAAQLVDDIHAAIASQLPDVSKRDVRDAISGYSIGPKSTRTELQRQIDSLKSELRQLSKSEDISAGRRSPRQEGPQREFQRDLTRQRAIQRQIDDLQQQMDSGQFRDKSTPEPPRYTRETYRLQKEMENIRLEYERMRYRATASPSTRIGHEIIKGVNVLKTVKSIGDVSAMLRQGGFYAITHPVEGLLKPTQAMIQSFTDMGYRNVEAAIKNDPAYDTLKRAGVEFTGVERNNPHLSVREEGYLGQEYLQYVPGLKQVANFSERTFVSFLDAQRLSMGKQMMEGLTESQRANPKELQAIAKLINAGTGRGNLGARGNAAAPLLNLAIFSPRLLVSRVQLLNNMISPRKLAQMPAGARARMIKDNVKFIGATMVALGLAKAAGADVNLDSDDSDFLKIRVGNTTYDTLTGLQQPLRYFINMGRAISADVTGDETYAGLSKGELTSRFTRSKLSPATGLATDYISGQDFMGRKFSWKNAAKEAALPLPAKDVIEAMKNEGLWGGVKATPTFVGIGTGNYPPPPERATTRAEKLARKITRSKLPDEARTQEEVDVDRQGANLRARSRRGEDVSSELEQLRGKLTDRQIKAIVSARNKTRLQEDVNRLGIKDALLVYSVASEQQRGELKSLVERKTALITSLPASEQAQVRQRLTQFGFSIPTMRITRPSRESRQSRAER